MTYNYHTIWHRLILLLIFVPGCTISPLRFKAIDAETKQSLPGVILEHHAVGNSEVFAFYHDFDIKYPPSATDGIVVTQRIDTDHYFHGFEFRKSGYLATAATFEQYKLRIEVYPGVPDGAFSGVPAFITSKLDEVILIPMYRVNSPNAPVYEIPRN